MNEGCVISFVWSLNYCITAFQYAHSGKCSYPVTKSCVDEVVVGMAGCLLHVLWLVSSLPLLWAASSPSPVAPIVTNISANQEVTSPAPVSFSCTVDSYPPSNITWLHNGAEVPAAPPRVTISTVQVDNRTQESNLTLLNTTAEDIGTYTCSAANDEGSNNMTTELQVLGE